MATKVTTATVIFLLVLFDVRTSHPQTCDEPECMINDECPTNQACRLEKCVDPCLFSVCGQDAICQVTNNIPICACPVEYTGHPMQRCFPPECQGNVDCASDRACSGYRCVDPCHFVTCGLNTVCHATNHSATCIGYTENNINGCQLSENTVKTKKFQLYRDKERSWQGALHNCSNLGMNLVTITNQQEQDTVQELTKGLTVWLGGSDVGDTGNYTWRSTNSRISYSNWEVDEPSNGHENPAHFGYCMAMNRKGKWCDTDCRYLLHYVCEYYD